MGFLNDTSILSKDKYDLVKTISKSEFRTKILYGGSLALNYAGVISRQIGDLDLIMSPATFSDMGADSKFIITPASRQSYINEQNDYTHITRSINDVPCCIFLYSNFGLHMREKTISPNIIYIQNINAIFNAKKRYIKHAHGRQMRMTKHHEDLRIYKTQNIKSIEHIAQNNISSPRRDVIDKNKNKFYAWSFYDYYSNEKYVCIFNKQTYEYTTYDKDTAKQKYTYL